VLSAHISPSGCANPVRWSALRPLIPVGRVGASIASPRRGAVLEVQPIFKPREAIDTEQHDRECLPDDAGGIADRVPARAAPNLKRAEMSIWGLPYSPSHHCASVSSWRLASS